MAAVAIPRTLSDGSLKMQVMLPLKVDGVTAMYWHRQMTGFAETACEIERPAGQTIPFRREALHEENGAGLCPFCFTCGERRRSLELTRQAAERMEADLDKWTAEAKAKRESNDLTRQQSEILRREAEENQDKEKKE